MLNQLFPVCFMAFTVLHTSAALYLRSAECSWSVLGRRQAQQKSSSVGYMHANTLRVQRGKNVKKMARVQAGGAAPRAKADFRSKSTGAHQCAQKTGVIEPSAPARPPLAQLARSTRHVLYSALKT